MGGIPWATAPQVAWGRAPVRQSGAAGLADLARRAHLPALRSPSVRRREEAGVVRVPVKEMVSMPTSFPQLLLRSGTPRAEAPARILLAQLALGPTKTDFGEMVSPLSTSLSLTRERTSRESWMKCHRRPSTRGGVSDFFFFKNGEIYVTSTKNLLHGNARHPPYVLRVGLCGSATAQVRIDLARSSCTPCHRRRQVTTNP